MQIEARINQDQTISKDLNAVDQRGHKCCAGRCWYWPIADTFLYVEPLYIQSSAAKMPQLKKDRTGHGQPASFTRTSYDQALAQFGNAMQSGAIATQAGYRRSRPAEAHDRPGRPADRGDPPTTCTATWRLAAEATGPKRARRWKPSRRR